MKNEKFECVNLMISDRSVALKHVTLRWARRASSDD
jgi:hypothetical protein